MTERCQFDYLETPALDQSRVASDIEAFAQQNKDVLQDSESACHFREEVCRSMGQRGWIGTIAPREFGGLGGGVGEYCFVQEQCARQGLVSPQISIQGLRWLLEWGTPEQKQKYLAGMALGTIIFSESISEPWAGSSFKNMVATAKREGKGWLLNGHKTHVNLGAESHVTAFYAHAEEGLTSFLVDMDTESISTQRTDPIGLRLLPTADVKFQNVYVPDSCLLGPPGRGLDTFLSVFNLSRLGNASELIGLGRRGLTIALDYAKRRKVGDHLVASFQGLQWNLTECYASLFSARLARNRAASILERRSPEIGLATSIAKKLATDAAEKVAYEMFSVVGSFGLYRANDLAVVLNDIKVLRVAGGSLEVLRNYVAKELLKLETYFGMR